MTSPRTAALFPSLLASLLALAGCAATPVAGTTPTPAQRLQLQQVPERYVSASTPAEELDSLATWSNPDGRTWLIASGKASHRLSVYDTGTGDLLRTVGGLGKQPGQFKRPNGLAVTGDLLFVVERDNHRVQVLSLPDLQPLATFGETSLRSPYGIWLNETGPGRVEAYVTDSFMLGERFDVVPPLQELSQRVHRFRLELGADRISAEDAGTFGDVTEAGALRIVESIGGDPAHDRLLVADESTSANGKRRGSTLREYTLAGQYTGRSLPDSSFAAEAEGVALWACGGKQGYWITVDQLSPLTIFHAFDRQTLQLRGSFEGKVTAHTDGIALHATPMPAFPGGALFAVHEDRSVVAFDLRDVVGALGLADTCAR